MATTRLAADTMLGHLAKWLRLIGLDTTYGAHLSGRALVRHAQAEGRIILTRDQRLTRGRSPQMVVLIESDHFRDQLKQVISALHLEPLTGLFTRCARCNEPVAPVPKSTIEGQVPAYVLATQERFARCPRCRRIYWPATHHDRIRDELQMIGLHVGGPAAC